MPGGRLVPWVAVVLLCLAFAPDHGAPTHARAGSQFSFAKLIKRTAQSSVLLRQNATEEARGKVKEEVAKQAGLGGLLAGLKADLDNTTAALENTTAASGVGGNGGSGEAGAVEQLLAGISSVQLYQEGPAGAVNKVAVSFENPKEVALLLRVLPHLSHVEALEVTTLLHYQASARPALELDLTRVASLSTLTLVDARVGALRAAAGLKKILFKKCMFTGLERISAPGLRDVQILSPVKHVSLASQLFSRVSKSVFGTDKHQNVTLPFAQLKGVETLEVSHSSAEVLWPTPLALPRLRRLSVRKAMSGFDPTTLVAPNLEMFEFTDGAAGFTRPIDSTTLAGWPRLSVLRLRNFPSPPVTPGIVLPAMEEVQMASCRLTSPPAGLGRTRLVDLSENSLTALAGGRANEVIFLQRNRIAEPPHGPRLRVLNIAENRVTRIDKLLQGSGVLTDLDISDNPGITNIPGEFALSRIRVLRADRCSINKTALMNTVHLREVSMSGNMLTKMPALRYKGLTKLDLSKNMISRFGAYHSEIATIYELNLSDNMLTGTQEIFAKRDSSSSSSLFFMRFLKKMRKRKMAPVIAKMLLKHKGILHLDGNFIYSVPTRALHGALAAKARLYVDSTVFQRASYSSAGPDLDRLCNVLGNCDNSTIPLIKRVLEAPGMPAPPMEGQMPGLQCVRRTLEGAMDRTVTIRECGCPGSTYDLGRFIHRLVEERRLSPVHLNATFSLSGSLVGNFSNGIRCEACAGLCEDGTIRCPAGQFLDFEMRAADWVISPSNHMIPFATCVPCPVGGECVDGRVIPKINYWRSSLNSTRVYKCNGDDQCLGGENSDCAGGHTGVLCGECEVGYFASSNGQCKRCGDVWASAVTAVVVVMGVAVAIIVFAALGERMSRSVTTTAGDSNGAHEGQGLLSMEEGAMMGTTGPSDNELAAQLAQDGVGFAQLIAVLPTVYDASWDSALKEMMSSLSVLNMNFLSAGSVECAWEGITFISTEVVRRDAYTYYHSVSLKLLLMMGGVLCAGMAVPIAACVRCVVRPLRGVPQSVIQDVAFRAVFMVTLAAYIPVSSALFKFFNCVTFDEGHTFYMKYHLETRCYDTSYYTFMPISLTFITLYSLGLPLVLFCCGVGADVTILIKSGIVRGALGRVLMVFRSTNRVFRRGFLWWDAVDMARVLLCSCVIMLVVEEPAFQLLLCLLVSGAALVFHALALPYTSRILNTTKAAGLIVVCMVLVCGMLGNLSVSPRQQSIYAGVVTLVLTVVLLAFVVIAMGMAAAALNPKHFRKLRAALGRNK